MPEACFLCLDSSEYMRNGDLLPNRMMAEQEAANLLVNAKTQINAENTVGFLTTGGNACTVFETLTDDVDRVMAALTNIRVGGKRCFFSNGLLIASLALSHRTNPRAEKRIITFVGSPVQETPKELESLAKKLRKDDVAVDVVAFGVDENVPLLTEFVEKVGKQGNSRILCVPQNGNLVDALMSSPIMLGEDAFGDSNGGNGNPAASGNAFHQFGVDPSMDPELAMALRMSMEEEQQRQAAAAAAAAAGNAAPSGGDAQSAEGAAPTSSAPAAPASSAAAPAAGPSEDDFANMSEEEMLRRALAMSLEEANAAANQSSSAPPPAQNEEEDSTQPSGSAPATANEETSEEQFMKDLQNTLNQQKK